MRKPRTSFDENTLVKHTKNSSDYLSIVFQEPTEYRPYCVRLNRYCVPGRCSIYSFDYVYGSLGLGDRVRFFADDIMNLTEALKLLQQDLEKPTVVELLTEICRQQHMRGSSRDMIVLLDVIAPTSKATRSCKRAYARTLAEYDRLCQEQKQPPNAARESQIAAAAKGSTKPHRTAKKAQ